MNYDKGPKYIYAQEHNSVLLLLSLCISIIITLEGIEKIIKTKIKRKKKKKLHLSSLKKISFINAARNSNKH